MHQMKSKPDPMNVPTPLTYQLLAIDLDGTLLDSEGSVPGQNREALHRAHEAGVRVVLCTGRALAETRPVLDQIGLDLDAVVTSSGAVVSDAASGRTLHRSEMSTALARELHDWLAGRGHTLIWMTDPDAHGHDGYALVASNCHPSVANWVEHSPCRVSLVDVIPSEAPAPLRLAVLNEVRVIESITAELDVSFEARISYNVLRSPRYDVMLVEIFGPGISKWTGVSWLCERWGIEPQRTAAVGDDMNDIVLIREAGLGVAMANARPEVHAVADETTASNDEAGVANLVDRLVPGAERS